MPVTRVLPYQWYDTPNIRVGTYADFEVLARKDGLRMLDSFGIQNGRGGAALAEPAGERRGVQVRARLKALGSALDPHRIAELVGPVVLPFEHGNLPRSDRTPTRRRPARAVSMGVLSKAGV